jgi:hypothetical protein
MQLSQTSPMPSWSKSSWTGMLRTIIRTGAPAAAAFLL